MKRKKTNLMNDKNLKKKIVVIGAVFFIISVGLNINMDYFFPQKNLKIQEEEEPEKSPIINPAYATIEKMLKRLNENMMYSYISQLTQPGAHPTATRIRSILSNLPIIRKIFDLPIKEVADYISTELNNMGLKVDIQHWKKWTFPRIYEGNIIVATIPGTNSSSNEIYILVSHYDTKLGSPGANDGSSGVAALLATANLMSQYKFEHTVKFLFVDGHKQGCIGSEKYVEEAKKNNDNIVGVICIDTIGIPGPDYMGDEVIITFKKTFLANYTGNVNDRYPGIFNFRLYFGNLVDHRSDHESFLDHGYDAICISGVGKEDNTVLKPSDTIDNIDFSYATKVTKLVIATICELALDLR